VNGTNIEFQKFNIAEGKPYCELQAHPNSHNGIQQTIKVVPGKTYVFMLDYQERTDMDAESGVEVFTLVGENKTKLELTSLAEVGGWIPKFATFIGPASSGTSSGQKVDVTFKIVPPSAPTSKKNGWTGFVKNVRLLPVDIVDNNKNPISKLKVGKMSEAGVLGGTEASATLDIDKDSDRFYVRVKGGAAIGGISVKVSTTDNPEAAYNDNATQIDLVPDGADAISKPMLLVSDDVDDDHSVDGIADDAPGDRTHKIQLGGNFKIEEIKIGAGSWEALGTKLTVPVEKTVNFGVVILRQSTGGAPVIAQTTVEQDLKVAQERYAQAGIKLSWLISIADPPAGVDLSDGLTEFTTTTPSAEESALLTSSLATSTTDDLHIFYVNHLAPAPGSFGEAFPEAIFGVFGGNMIVSSTRMPFTLPHELGHILRNDNGGPQTHSADPFHLMRGGGTSATNRLGASKRVTVNDESTMRGSKYAK